ncbi:MAG TPA: Os1348 family NHLP clan protein [Ktedonobacteraceae bacterium]|nr:Os1348 family NHLP clan protein [Ktedonobacteraceae bacterium]
MMSWKTINAILGLATVDDIFCQELLQNPVEAIKQRQFTLTKDEEEKLSRIAASNLAEFSQQVLILFGRKE